MEQSLAEDDESSLIDTAQFHNYQHHSDPQPPIPTAAASMSSASNMGRDSEEEESKFGTGSGVSEVTGTATNH